MLDYILCISVRLLGFIFRKLPLRLSLAIGTCLGGVVYHFRRKRRRIAYVNLKAAFSSQKTPRELTAITKKTFQNLGRNLIEVLLFPKIDERYVEKYIRMEGIEEVDKALRHGKGAILLTAHLGNWELGSLTAAIKGYPLTVLARQQKFPRLNKLLISYREMKGCRIISKGMATREIFRALRNNEIVGILADQDAGSKGVFVNFFGRQASTPAGAIKFALKAGSKVLPAFTIRERGPYHRIVIKPPLELGKTDDSESNVKIALEQFTSYLEDYISSYPGQWLWQHKRWKSTPSRSVIILSDAKAGHLNQSKAVARAIEKVSRFPSRVTIKVVEVKFKNRFAQNLLSGCAGLSCIDCQGCMRCLNLLLSGKSYQELIAGYADIVISAGTSLCVVNLILSRENFAKSIVLMKPPSFLVDKFNLIIVPKHDNLKARPNVVETSVAPNLIDSEYLSKQAKKLKMLLSRGEFGPCLYRGGVGEEVDQSGLTLGVLIGGETPHFTLSRELMTKVIDEVLKVSSQLNAPLFLSTSRRTTREVDDLLKAKLAHFKLCKLLVIANENNIEEAVGGILGLSQIVIVSGESISMVSEAISSGKYVVVFKPESMPHPLAKRRDKHERFLEYLVQGGFITLVRPEDLAETVKKIWIERSPLRVLDDNQIICEAVKRLI